MDMSVLYVFYIILSVERQTKSQETCVQIEIIKGKTFTTIK